MTFPELSDSLRSGIGAEFKEISRGSPDRAAKATQRFYREQAALVVADLRQKSIIA
jgi:hypothetical protein